MPQDAIAPIPESLEQGIQQFNQGQYYACHDTLEALWMEAGSPEKSFYQGILQIAVALYHLGNHNWRGAAILLGEGMRRLEPYEPSYYGVNVSALLDGVAPWLTVVQQHGEAQGQILAKMLQGNLSGEVLDVDFSTLPILRIEWASSP